MAFRFIAILALVTVASAGVLPHPQVYHQSPTTVVKTIAPVTYAHSQPQVYHPAPVPTTVVKTIAPVAYAHAQPILAKHDTPYDPNPQYKYGYEVNDQQTGDNHSHSEERDGDVVHGEYSLIDADGFRRVVQYTVDPHSGFNAVVNRIPLEHVKTVVKQVAAPVTYVAPTPTVVKQYPVPQAYHQHH